MVLCILHLSSSLSSYPLASWREAPDLCLQSLVVALDWEKMHAQKQSW